MAIEPRRIHWKNWTSSRAWKFYFQNIPIVFLEYFHTTDNICHTMELDKTMEIGFFNLFLQYFQYFHSIDPYANMVAVN